MYDRLARKWQVETTVLAVKTECTSQTLSALHQSPQNDGQFAHRRTFNCLLITDWLLANLECWHCRQRRQLLLFSGKLQPDIHQNRLSILQVGTHKLCAPPSGTCRASNSSSSSADQALSRTFGTASCGHLAHRPFQLCRTCLFVWAAITQMLINASYDLKFFNNNALFNVIDNKLGETVSPLKKTWCYSGKKVAQEANTILISGNSAPILSDRPGGWWFANDAGHFANRSWAGAVSDDGQWDRVAVRWYSLWLAAIEPLVKQSTNKERLEGVSELSRHATVDGKVERKTQHNDKVNQQYCYLGERTMRVAFKRDYFHVHQKVYYGCYCHWNLEVKVFRWIVQNINVTYLHTKEDTDDDNKHISSWVAEIIALFAGRCISILKQLESRFLSSLSIKLFSVSFHSFYIITTCSSGFYLFQLLYQQYYFVILGNRLFIRQLGHCQLVVINGWMHWISWPK